MLNIGTHAHASVVLVILLYHYMLQNKQSNRHTYSMTSVVCVLCISNKVEYLDKKRGYKCSTKEVMLSF